MIHCRLRWYGRAAVSLARVCIWTGRKLIVFAVATCDVDVEPCDLLDPPVCDDGP